MCHVKKKNIWQHFDLITRLRFCVIKKKKNKFSEKHVYISLSEVSKSSGVSCQCRKKSLPSLHVERREGPERGLTCEKLEAALRVLDPSHAEEPHQEVKAVHEERAKHRSLWQRHNSGYLMLRRMQSTWLYSLQPTIRRLPELPTLAPGELGNRRKLPCSPKCTDRHFFFSMATH